MRKEELEELDDWFDNEEDEEGNQDLSASTDELEDADGSPLDATSEELPDETVSQDDTAEEAASNESTSASSTTKGDDPYAWVADLPPELEELRKHAEALVRRDQSNTGRVAAMRSRLDELEAAKEARKTVGVSSPSKEAEPSLEDVGEMNDDELEEFRKEFPSVAANVDKIVAQQIAKEREEILGQVRPIQEERAQQKILAEKTHLRTEAEKIFDTANTGIHLEDVLQSQEWQAWLGSQPEAYQQFARTARDAGSALIVLKDFDEYARATFSEAEPATDEESSKVSTRADETAARRKAALQSDSPSSRTAQVDDAALGDYEAYFDEAVANSGN